jgi:hypothetical protein
MIKEEHDRKYLRNRPSRRREGLLQMGKKCGKTIGCTENGEHDAEGGGNDAPATLRRLPLRLVDIEFTVTYRAGLHLGSARGLPPASHVMRSDSPASFRTKSNGPLKLKLLYRNAVSAGRCDKPRNSSNER